MSTVKFIRGNDLTKLEHDVNAALADAENPREFHSLTLGVGHYVATLVPRTPAIEAVLEEQAQHVGRASEKPRRERSGAKKASKSRE